MILITYNGYTVEVHDELQAPKQFLTVEVMLRSYVNQALQASTKPAVSQPASQTAPATGPRP